MKAREWERRSRRRLAQRSKKMQRHYDEQRIPAVRAAVGDGRRPCAIVSPICTRYVEGLHEVLTRGRGGGLRAVDTEANRVPCCHACNQYVSLHPAWAHELGWLKHAWEDT